MKEYTFSEARQRFSSLLDRARKEGSVRIRRRDGQIFILQPEAQKKSTLDVDGIKTQLNRNEIVDIIRTSRRNFD
jgi:antitoxin (DNA-binding transcriptional repressor) of toxin-antitoxin stability system